MSGAPPPPRLRQRAAKVEYLAYLSIALSISMAAAKGPTYNLAVALLNLFSSHTRRGRHLFASMVCIVASIVIGKWCCWENVPQGPQPDIGHGCCSDIIRVVAVTFDDFNDTFAFIMIIGNIVAKVLILGFR